MTDNIPASSEEFVSHNTRCRIEESLLILLLLLSLLGVGITNFSPADGYWYWMLMIFIFGLSAMIIGWMQARRRDHLVRDLLVVQSLHWGGSMLAVVGTFSLLHAGVLSEDSTGLVILLILALATFLDGIRVGWRFSMVGLFLGITAIIVAYIESYLWISILLALLIAGFTIYWDNRRQRPNA